MYFKTILIVFLVFILGCSNTSEKNSYNVNLLDYLPEGNSGSIYKSVFTHTNGDVVVERKTIVDRNNSCVTFNVKILRNGEIKSDYNKRLCANKYKLYYDFSPVDEPIIDIRKKSWTGLKINIGGQREKMICSIGSFGLISFEGNKHKSFTVTCKAKRAEVMLTYAKNLGLFEIKQSIDDFGVVGGLKLKSVKLHH